MADAKKILWQNIQQLMLAQWGKLNLSRLARESGVGEASIHRLPKTDLGVELATIVGCAKALKRHPWQLLHPNPDQVHALSDMAVDVGQLFDRVPRDQQRPAYALIVQLLQFANTGPLPGLPASQTPTDEPPPAPGTRPVEDPDERPTRHARAKAPRRR